MCCALEIRRSVWIIGITRQNTDVCERACFELSVLVQDCSTDGNGNGTDYYTVLSVPC